MKLLHLSDLHLGKRVNEISMLEDQREILTKVLALCGERRPDVVLIAGDIYDRSVPSTEAVGLLDDFLTALCGRGIPCMIVSGNHDSPERLAFAGRILGQRGIFLAGGYGGTVRRVTLEDEYGPADFWLLPFLRPADTRRFFPEREIASYDDAVRAALSAAEADPKRRNVLVAHQFVISGKIEPERSDSELPSVGGIDSVDVSAFDRFDYVALGHLHGPQRIGRDTVRYAGSPLKYSFSELRQKKSAVLVTLERKGQVSIELLPLVPRREMREIRGPLEDLVAPEVAAMADPEDYIRAILTDEEEPAGALERLRAVYPNLMRLEYDNRRTRAAGAFDAATGTEIRDPFSLFAEFYELQNNLPLDGERAQLVRSLFEGLGEEEKA